MDMQWLATEAKQIHTVFSSMFYSMVLSLLALGVLLSFFKMSMGQIPEFMTLVGRALVAALILAAYPEIMNTLADITDQLASEIGQINNFKLVVSRLGEKIGTLTFSWVSVKDSVILVVSYLTYFLLYVSVYVADAMYVFVWAMLYVFSPILIAAFTLPTTAAATKGLFQSLIEVCLWKITWAVLAALLWSFALSQINDPKYEVDFLTAIILNLLLAFSLLLTPFVVRSLIKSGMSMVAASTGGAVLASAALTPGGVIATGKQGVRKINGSVSRLREEDEEGVSRHKPQPYKG